MPIRDADAEHISPRTSARLYNELEKCAKWFDGQSFTPPQDLGLNPKGELEKADAQIRKSKEWAERQG